MRESYDIGVLIQIEQCYIIIINQYVANASTKHILKTHSPITFSHNIPVRFFRHIILTLFNSVCKSLKWEKFQGSYPKSERMNSHYQ